MDSSQITPWNKYLPVKINKMLYNQDHSLFVLSTTRGYRVFDSKTFTSVCKVDDYQDIIGDIACAMTLYKSQLIYFVGNDENISYTRTQLVVWDDIKKSKKSMIFVKEPIITFTLTKNILYIMTGNSMMLFDNISFKYIHKIDNINMNEKLFSIAHIEGNSSIPEELDKDYDVLAYNTFKNKNIIYLRKYYTKKHRIQYVKKTSIETKFRDIQSLYISRNGTQLVAINVFGNKIHIYDIDNENNLRLCLFIGNHIASIDNVVISSKKEKYMMFISEGKNIKVFAIKDNFESNFKCFCDMHNDDELIGMKKSDSHQTFFGFFGSVIYYSYNNLEKGRKRGKSKY